MVSIGSYLDTLRQITAHPLNRKRKASAVIDYLRWNLGQRLLDRDHVLPLAGDARVILSRRQNYATLAYTCALWDFSEMMFLLHALRPTDKFIDIGANVGTYSVLASKVAGASSIAFEPIPTTHDELMQNLRLNNILDKAVGHRLCLGSTNGKIHMTIGRGALDHVATQGDTGKLLETEVVRLDDVLQDGGCRLIKIDAEGYEAEILSGATKTLQNPELIGLIVELNGAGLRYGHSNESVHETLLRYDFAPYRYDGVDRSLYKEPTFNTSGLNTLYLRDLGLIERRLRDASAVTVRGQTL